RRRHTRFSRDWSSDVCSSDLGWDDHILEAIRIKAEIVNRDPLEQGSRRLLNFGHTLGHAFETWSLRNDKSPLTHGEAVAMGMIRSEERRVGKGGGCKARGQDT